MNGSQTACHPALFDGLLCDFLDESDRLLAQLHENLQELDQWTQWLGDGHPQRSGPELLHEMFRSAHRLMGLSAMLGLTDISQLTHQIERVFDAARHERLTITRDVTELVSRRLDRLAAMVGWLKEPGGCEAALAGEPPRLG